MEVVGLQLLADGADKYLAQLTAGATAEERIAKAATDAVGSINALGDSQDRAAQSTMRLASDANKTAAEIENTAEAAARSAGAYQDAGGRWRDASGKFLRLGEDAEKAGKGVAELGEKGDKAKGGLDGLKQSAIGAAREIGANLVDATAEAGQAIVQFIGESIGEAGDFEQGMNRFASVTGDALNDSGQSLEEFKDLFISLGRELPVSTAEVQQAAIEMAKGGIEPATIAAGGLRDVLNLAAAGEVGIAEAAEIASKQLGVWVDSAANAEEKAAFLTEAVDLLSQAANASTVDVDDLALGLANTGKSADIAGLSFRETVTSMALISSGFASSADAGTSFKTFLQRLTPTTDSQSEAFKRLNLLTKDGQSVFYATTGTFIGMDKAAELLKQSLEGMGDAQRKSALEAAFGADAIRAAGMLADAGADGYARMAAEMAKAGSAAIQAARKQQGFNVAVDNALGSVEALQITVMSAALPALTDLINTLAGGVNALTDYAAATERGETALAAIANVISTLAMPALYGLSAATLVYALTNAPALIVALSAEVIALEAKIVAMWAANAATLAAIAPYALLVAAIGAVAWAYQDFNQKNRDATTQLLESRTWWNDSTTAIEQYGVQVGIAKDRLAPFATEIANIRTQLEFEIADLAKRDAAGLVSNEQRTTEMAHINALAGALQGATSRYTDQEQAIISTSAAGMTATAQTASMISGEQALSTQTSLTTKDIEDLGKKITSTFEQGQQALSTYATNYSAFASGVEERSAAFNTKMADLERQKQDATTAEQKAGIDEQITQLRSSYADQESAAAASYATQQQAQQQHLGQMLIDYTVAQAQLGNISKEKAAQVTEALETEYGLQESSTATTFLNMAQSIDAFASDSGASISGLIGDLRDQQTAAGETQQAMDAYAKEYTATQVNNFLDGKTDADDYIASLERIPSHITTTVTTKYVTEGAPSSGGSPATGGARAQGGPVDPMTTYLVGERGQELFTATTAGYITPTDAVRRAMASQSQLGSTSPTGSWSTSTVINVDARGSNLSMADVTMAVQAGLAAEGRSADIRTRMGVQ